MNSDVTEHALFRPPRPKPATKADITDKAARAIVGAEAERRQAKTARLREARLVHEAKLPAIATPVRPRRAKPAVVRRTRSSA